MSKLPPTCPACDSSDLYTMLELAGAPVNIGVLWPSAEAARNCPRGDIRLAACRRCGLIANVAFDPSLLDYSAAYANSLDHSPRFSDYARDLATRLVREHHLNGKSILEIGCGRGDFLRLMCASGANRGIGFDTSYVDNDVAPDVSIVPAHYGPEHGDYRANLVVCRQVLEHIDRPAAFIKMLRINVEQQRETVVFFEVPNADMILKRLSIWDIIYEHCCYYSRESLRSLFERSGFDVLGVRDEFDGQFLSIEARLAYGNSGQKPNNADTGELLTACESFAHRFESRRGAWRDRITDLRQAGKTAVVWGAGARAVSFMNLFDVGDKIEYLVDINPRKQGAYLPGAGQPTLSPEQLAEHRPDVVIVMNSIYRNEIEHQLRDLNLHPEILIAQESPIHEHCC